MYNLILTYLLYRHSTLCWEAVRHDPDLLKLFLLEKYSFCTMEFSFIEFERILMELVFHHRQACGGSRGLMAAPHFYVGMVNSSNLPQKLMAKAFRKWHFWKWVANGLYTDDMNRIIRTTLTEWLAIPSRLSNWLISLQMKVIPHFPFLYKVYYSLNA